MIDEPEMDIPRGDHAQRHHSVPQQYLASWGL